MYVDLHQGLGDGRYSLNLMFHSFFLPMGYNKGEENATSSLWVVISTGIKSGVRGVMSYVQKVQTHFHFIAGIGWGLW